MTRSEQLLAWYDAKRRALPWRGTTDPYRVLVSEVMSQQTQIARVIPYYQRFIERFPTTGALATAPLSDVLAMWSGLGYNRRAANLREAARHVTDHGWPDSPAGLEKLPGVGPYTAAAIACFAFGLPVPAVDTNLRRVLARWTGRELTTGEARSVALEEIAQDRAADWNQAMMDLGSGLCTSRAPSCEACPVAATCADPAIYAPPARQSRFTGSAREARGAALKVLVGVGSATADELAARSQISRSRLDAALTALQSEGLVVHADGCWSIVG